MSGLMNTALRTAMSLGLCSLAAACGGGSGGGDIDNTPPPTSHSLGLMQITISGLGGSAITSRAVMLSGSGSGSGAQAHVAMPATESAGVDVQLVSTNTLDIGVAGSGGERYVAVAYRVRNAQFCGTPGSCVPYTAASHNLTLVAANTAANINNTAINSIRLNDGTSSPATQALATSVLPTHGMDFNSAAGAGVLVDPSLASLQVYTELEMAGIKRDTGATDLFPYGYVVSNISTPGSRSLPASPANNQWDGQVALSFKLPLQTDHTQDPYSISLIFQVIDDGNTRVTESLEEQSVAGDVASGLRAATLGSVDLAVLGGRVAQTNIGDPICTVRTAGTIAVPISAIANNNAPKPAATLVSNTRIPGATLVDNSGATLASAPYNLQYLAPAGAVNVGFCTTMHAASFGTMVVSGSQSGQRTAAGPYSGIYTGNAAGNGLSFIPATGHPFFAGETVSYTLTTGLTSGGGVALASPFVGSYVVGGNFTAPTSPGTFSLTSSPATGGSSPNSVAVGDFDGDGRPDLAVVNGGESTVSILFNNGGGGFYTLPGNLPVKVGTSPSAIVAGDFNGDGRPDLAVVNASDSTVSILLNNGGGNFFTPAGYVPVSVGFEPLALAVGDFNGDGYLDLAVANQGDNTVSILLNNGSGGFTPAAGSPLQAGNNPYFVAVGDFNGDGRPDIAVVNQKDNTVSIFLNSGNGGFAPAAGSPVKVGSGPQAVAVGDFNGDGHPDLAVANYTANTISILINNGSGGFTLASSPSASGGSPDSIAVGDFNGDGHPDLAVANFNSGAISIFLNNGSGGFKLGSSPTAGLYTNFVAVGDFDADGHLDLAVTNLVAGTVSILSGKPPSP